MTGDKPPFRIATPTEWRVAPLPAMDGAQRWKYHIAFTPTHEAGHAVALRLAGHDILYIRFVPVHGELRDAMGVTGYRNPRSLKELLAQEGRGGVFREMVSALAGPAAEIRLGGRYAGKGMEADCDIAINLANWFPHHAGGPSAHDALQAAWEEAHRLVSDPRAWAAIQAIAQQAGASKTSLDEVSGDFVHSTVESHLPDGWEYRLPDWAA